MAQQIQLRRDTAANWTSANPVLAEGEKGVETDTGKEKTGDGTTAWTSLAYFGGSGGGAVDSVNAQTGVVVLDADDIDDTSTTNKFATAGQLSAVDALGTASTAATGDFATAAQGATADGAIPKSLVDAKGDLLVASADNVVTRLAKGTDTHVLTADSSTGTGLKWAAAAGGGATSGVLSAMNSTQQVSNTTTETTVATLAVPAGAVDTANTFLHIMATGAVLNNSGTNLHKYRLKINGTTVMLYEKSLAASGSYFAWTMTWTIGCPTNASQRIGYDVTFAGMNTSAGVANGSAAGGTAAGYNTSTVDMSGALDITFTIEQAIASVQVRDDVFGVTLLKSAPF